MRTYKIGMVAGIGFFLVSCASNNFDPRLPSTALRIVEDSVALQQAPAGTFFRVTLVIRNTAGQQVRLGGCGPGAQRNIDGQWKTVWTPICLTPTQAVIEAGDSLTIAVSASGATQPAALPQESGQLVAGLYRLSVGVWYPESPDATAPVRLQEIDSPAFKVY